MAALAGGSVTALLSADYVPRACPTDSVQDELDFVEQVLFEALLPHQQPYVHCNPMKQGCL